MEDQYDESQDLEQQFIIVKDNLYWRVGRAGYTNKLSEAARFTLDKLSDIMTSLSVIGDQYFMREEDAPAIIGNLLQSDDERYEDRIVNAAQVLLTAMERAQISTNVLKMFYNGEPTKALKEIIISKDN